MAGDTLAIPSVPGTVVGSRFINLPLHAERPVRMVSDLSSPASQGSIRYIITVISTPEPITLDVIATHIGIGWCLTITPGDDSPFDVFVPFTGPIMDYLGRMTGML